MRAREKRIRAVVNGVEMILRKAMVSEWRCLMILSRRIV
jgi:hypothetical protein